MHPCCQLLIAVSCNLWHEGMPAIFFCLLFFFFYLSIQLAQLSDKIYRRSACYRWFSCCLSLSGGKLDTNLRYATTFYFIRETISNDMGSHIFYLIVHMSIMVYDGCTETMYMVLNIIHWFLCYCPIFTELAYVFIAPSSVSSKAVKFLPWW